MKSDWKRGDHWILLAALLFFVTPAPKAQTAENSWSDWISEVDPDYKVHKHEYIKYRSRISSDSSDISDCEIELKSDEGGDTKKYATFIYFFRKSGSERKSWETSKQWFAGGKPGSLYIKNCNGINSIRTIDMD